MRNEQVSMGLMKCVVHFILRAPTALKFVLDKFFKTSPCGVLSRFWREPMKI